MGAYLSYPITEKFSSDENNDRLKCGASSMQGWRVSQEDAHNAILNFTEHASLFAVYDGHGGKEVAEYTALKLPDVIKALDSFKNGDYGEALKEAFLKYDQTLIEAEVIKALKVIADQRPAGASSADEEEGDNIKDLREEAAMTIEQVMAKYKANRPAEPSSSPSKDSEAGGSSKDNKAGGSSKDNEAGGSSNEVGGSSSQNACADGVSSSSSIAAASSSSSGAGCSSVSSSRRARKSLAEKYSNGEVEEDNEVDSTADVVQNGGPEGVEGDGEEDTNEAVSSSVSKDEEGPSPSKKANVISAKSLFKKFVTNPDAVVEEDSSDSDENFPEEGEGGESSTSDADAEPDEDDDDDELDDEEEEDEDDEEEDEDDAFTMSMSDEPGAESGCTAVVALVLPDRVFVANAGDSRCVACRAGRAVDLSVDHKPEDPLELERITKAGGKVTCDGRVNGGLNLSRALGDHMYKKVADIPLEKQMISPLPDIQELPVTDDVEFLVLACDGIWNYMTSQQVIDFVRQRLKKNPDKLSTICEELFDHCLAPNTMGDGTGCDNMTAVVVQLRPIPNGPVDTPATVKNGTAENEANSVGSTETTESKTEVTSGKAETSEVVSESSEVVSGTSETSEGKRKSEEVEADDGTVAPSKKSKTDSEDFPEPAP